MVEIKVSVLGYGYWGPNFLRNFYQTDGFKVVGCVDLKQDRLDQVKNKYSFITTSTNASNIMQQSDAVAIATPPPTHYSLAKEALKLGKHVLVTKPLVLSTDHAQELFDLADKNNVILMVDHTFLFSPPVIKMKELVDSGELGDVYYFDSVRINLGLFQHDTNVVWDLAPHDLSIMSYLIQEKPLAIQAVGVSHIRDNLENMAYITLKFASQKIAHIHVNWLTPVKVRKTLIGGSKKMIVYDDLDKPNQIKVYDKGVDLVGGNDVYDMLVQYRIGDMYAPKLDKTEPLKLEMEQFQQAINRGQCSFHYSEEAIDIVRMLEAIDESLNRGGKEVSLE